MTSTASLQTEERRAAQLERLGDILPERWRTLTAATLGSILLFLAFPPVGWSVLAWLAPCCWLWLIMGPRLPGPHPYRQLYFAGLIFWLLVIHWIRLPHWSAYLGWLVLAAYLACYLPLFAALTRVAVHQLCIPLVIAAPVTWVGLEWARGHVFTGFSMVLLGHSQSAWTHLIQISDLIGGYGVSFLVMFVSACIVATVCGLQRRWTAWPAVAAVVALSASWGYGVVRVAQMDQLPASAGQTRIALIQGSIDTTFDEDQDPSATFDQYHRLSQQANDEHAPLDAIIWPESMYTPAWFEAESPVQPPPDTGSGPDAYRRYVQTLVEHCRREAQRLANDLSTTLVLGSATFAFGPYEPRRFNSAICVAADGRVLGRYDKMHPVMFGEYVPLGNVFPWLYNLTPMGTGLTAGQRPLHVAVDGVGISPCICFENTIPHLIRRQVLELKKEGHDPDVLLTITNDGWFWGSSLLDLHLTCAIFRAIELRRPMLVAANTGFSAWIDAGGRVLDQGPRRETCIVVAKVAPRQPATTLYERCGDWPVAILLGLTLLVGLLGLRARWASATNDA